MEMRGDGGGGKEERGGENKNSWGNIRIDAYRASEGMLGNESVLGEQARKCVRVWQRASENVGVGVERLKRGALGRVGDGRSARRCGNVGL